MAKKIDPFSYFSIAAEQGLIKSAKKQKGLDVGKKGVRFKDVAEKVARSYKGKSWRKTKYKTRAELGRAIAGKMFWQKFGKKKGSQILRRAR